MTAPSIVILTGAGISAESGLGTFRDEGGLWAQHRIEDVATPEGFARNPQLVTEFYNADEVFVTGTMGELVPVRAIDGRAIRNKSGAPGLELIQQGFHQRIKEACTPLPD